MPRVASITKGLGVIFNPAARSTGAQRRVSQLRELAAGAILCETTARGDAQRFARALAEEGVHTVVAAGGDGTLNEVIAGIWEADITTKPALGVLPLGTMNVFAHEMGLPAADLAACWQRIEGGETREIDVWLANQHPFVQMAGVGLDALVIQDTSWEAKKKWGPLSYAATLARWLDRPPTTVRVSLDGGPWLTGTSVLAGNGALYGGPFRVFPDARNDDGRLDIALVNIEGPSAMAGLVADVVTALDQDFSGLSLHRASHVRIEADASLPFEVDGELDGSTPVELSRASHQLRVLV